LCTENQAGGVGSWAYISQSARCHLCTARYVYIMTALYDYSILHYGILYRPADVARSRRISVASAACTRLPVQDGHKLFISLGRRAAAAAARRETGRQRQPAPRGVASTLRTHQTSQRRRASWNVSRTPNGPSRRTQTICYGRVRSVNKRRNGAVIVARGWAPLINTKTPQVGGHGSQTARTHSYVCSKLK